MKILSILLSLFLIFDIASAQSFNPKGTYSGPLSLVDVGSIGEYPCSGSIGEVAFYEFDVSFNRRKQVVSAPYYNETMKGKLLPDQRAFKIQKRFIYAGLHPTTVTLKNKNITNTSAKMTFIYRFIVGNSSPQQGCVWTYRGDVTRVK
jgi:hypothetical protein